LEGVIPDHGKEFVKISGGCVPATFVSIWRTAATTTPVVTAGAAATVVTAELKAEEKYSDKPEILIVTAAETARGPKGL
jgi:hypothetical protein